MSAESNEVTVLQGGGVIYPGATIGMLGGGQLGRMFALSAAQLGYRVIGFTPEENSPLSQVTGETICAQYEDQEALKRFAAKVDVVTIEFENIPVETANLLAQLKPVRPRPQVLHIAQNRLREKSFLKDNGFKVAPFIIVKEESQLEEAIDTLGVPAVLKTTGFGYDGKGQRVVRAPEAAPEAWKSLNASELIVEEFIPFEREISVIGARSISGEFKAFGPIENQHKNHILDLSTVPAKLSWSLEEEAIEITRSLMEKLDVVGLLCVEFFLAEDERLLVNEVAPRPHNSGHYSIEACSVSQFEQHVRAITGLPLGKTHVEGAACMANLLGDVWDDGLPDWSRALTSDVHLHLYGKRDARPGRKMGHITALAKYPDEAKELARAARESLKALR
ncbi:MAG: 5-(carboxyamino)imidazole ribonucleotide synthase [Candidatus Obscuribacterales bacterium]